MTLKAPSFSMTLKILNIIGTPFSETEFSLNVVDGALIRYAVLNRIHLLFLESLNKHHIDMFSEEFKQLIERCGRINETIMKIAKALEKNNLKYSFFKTIRPYREVTVDIDTLIFYNRKNATRLLCDAGFKLLENGSLSTTLWDEESKINIDLYEEIGVSHLIYMDKEKAQQFIVRKTIGNGYFVRSLDAVADLLAIISHSIIKEQMYVLSEYFTTIHYLNQMDNQEINRLIETAEQWELEKALSTHLSITSVIHMKAHSFVPKPLKKLLGAVGYNCREVEAIKMRNYQMPYKYHPLTVIESFIEKLSEPATKRSLATQFFKLSNPKYASSFVKGALQHLKREGY